MKITIGANIKSLRQKKGITQDELSAAMNVSSAAVSKWERDETYPDITLLQPLAYYFGVSLDELMGYNKEKIQADIDNTVELYLKSYLKIGAEKTREFITKAYSDYPSYRGGTDEQVAVIQEKYLFAASLLTERMKKEDTLYHAFYDCRPAERREKPLIDLITDLRMNAKSGRRAELLKNPKYADALKKYIKS